MQSIIQIFLKAHQELAKQQLGTAAHEQLYKNLANKLIELNIKSHTYYFVLNQEADGTVFFELKPAARLVQEANPLAGNIDEMHFSENTSNAIIDLSQQPLVQKADLKITFTPPKNNSLSYSGEDAWMNWLRIEGDIATARHLQNHVKQLKLEQTEVLNAFIHPLLMPILGDRTLLISETIHQQLQQFLNISADFKNNTLHFLTQEREILATQSAFKEQQDELYHLSNDIDRMAQKIDYLTQILNKPRS
jgi:ubiquinone biosynthesis protein UbiJ